MVLKFKKPSNNNFTFDVMKKIGRIHFPRTVKNVTQAKRPFLSNVST